jgi:hypothetical protein
MLHGKQSTRTCTSARASRQIAYRRIAVPLNAVAAPPAAAATSTSRSFTVEQLKKLSLITAVKTPYLSNGKIDLKAYDAILERQIEAGG